MEFLRDFNAIGRGDAAEAGGKGASLGEMTQAGIPVPPGFVLLASAFDQFLKETDLGVEVQAQLDAVNTQAMHTVENASANIQELIRGAKMPEDIALLVQENFKKLDAQFVAVRSSATAEDSASAAWAGQLDSYLNTTEDTLLLNVQRCWASLFTPRAIFYRFEKELHKQHISVAVVVQKMVEAQVSGIAFSVHPVTEDYNQLIIEAGFGLGEAIVSGQVTPDSYVVEKTPRKIVDINVATQTRALYRAEGGGNEWKEVKEPQASSQVLTETQMLELSEIVIGIEKHYGFPCDIEWAFEEGRFYIVQSRPITTLTGGVSQKQVTLTKILEREYSLAYFLLWNLCDRNGLKKFTDQTVQHNLFIVPPRGKSGSVWYDSIELANLEQEALYKMAADKGIGKRMMKHLEDCWKLLEPYVKGEKEIQNGSELVAYHQTLTSYWSAMNTVFFRLPDHVEIDKDFFDTITRFREKTQEYTAATADMLVTSFERLFPKLAHLSHHVLPEDVAKLEGSIDTAHIAKLEKRAAEGCALLDGELISLTELDAAMSARDLRFESVDTNATEIQGKTGYAGKAEGIVRIISSKSGIGLLAEGEILVSAVTDPDFVPAMEKAAAIVTDEGGIMSHAAIVAREMKKPCVIGTKVATQVLKDGDTVEVDADKGVVRIVKSAGNPSDDTFFRELKLDRFENWNEQGRWILPPFVSSAMSMESVYAKELMPEVPLSAYFVIDHYAFQLKKDIVAILEYTKKRYLDQSLKELIAKLDEIGAGIVGKIEQELAKDEELRRKNATSILKLYQDLNDFWLLESYFGDLCIDLAKDVGLIKSEQELFGMVQPYLRDTWIEEEVHDVVHIAQYCIDVLGKDAIEKADVSDDEKLSSAIEKYLSKYSWSKYSWWLGSPIGLSDAILRVNQEIRNIREGNHIPTHKKAGTPEDAAVELSVVTSYWRAQCGRVVAVAGEKLGFVFEDIAKANSIAKEEALLLTYLEVQNILEKGDLRIQNLTEVLERKEGHFVMGDNKGGLIVFGHADPRYAPLKKLFVDRPTETKGDVLTGLAASSGKVTCKVRIIQSAKEFDTFKDGEILVSVETSPIFVPLMRKAGAILTGKGGITSHAAIVSRELKKPCIIAIKDIVKILKTGDMVEVDADKGIVRILKSAGGQVHPFKSSELQDFKPEDWQFMGTYAQKLFPSSFWGVYLDDTPIEESGFHLPFMGNIVFMGGSVAYYKPVYEDVERQLRVLIEAGNTEPFVKLREKAEASWARAIPFAERMAKEELTLQNLEEIYRQGRELTLYWCMTGAHLNYCMERIAQEQIVADKIPAEIAPALIPKVVTPSVRQQEEFFEIKKQVAGKTLEEVKADLTLVSLLEGHVERYGWIEIANWAGEPLTIEHLFERLQGGSAPVEVPAHNQQLSPRMQVILEMLGQVLYIKQSGAEYPSIFQWKVRPFFLRLCEKVGLSYDELMNLSFDEVRDAMTGKRTREELQEISKERGDNWLVMATTPGVVTEVFDAQDLAKLRDVWMPKVDASTKSVSGQIGNKGKATGPVRVILSLNEFEKMEEGDVLVTTMTTPEFVLLMQKASAIVTNMGGLLCHAAIVSRELNKPCVINTKVATEVFKDGDVVEVDADKGVVTITQHAKS